MREQRALFSGVLSPNLPSGICVLWMIILVLSEFCLSFNIDVSRPLVFQGTADTNFGAALDLLNNSDGKWVVIGAPLDTLSNAEGYSKTGNIYLCPIRLDKNRSDVTECSELNLPDVGKIVSDDSMFGSSVMVLEETTVVCAPGYKNTFKNNDTSGACVYFQNENPSDISSFLIRIPATDTYSFSWSMFGFSTTAGINKTFPYTIGGPNSGWQAGGLATFSITTRGLLSRSVPGTDSSQPGAYFGYSLATGVFDRDKSYYVAGRPGFANNGGNIGNVEILEFFENGIKTTKKLIAGFQLGGGFGHSVCVADVNGDSYDDVLIGAPLEYINESNRNIVIDSGAVYIYLGTGTPDILKETPVVIRGTKKQWARFGTAIVNLKDISNDDIADIAVGAPFEDDHRGAVYIYNGRSGNFDKPWTFSQRITSNDIGLGISALGYYLSKSQVDVDDNLYGDLAVSGFKTDQVVVLRTRPVAHVTADILTTPGYIPINSTGLECNLGSDIPCVTLNIRFLVSGKGLEKGVYLNYSLYSDVFSESERFLLRPNDSLGNSLNRSLESQLILLKPNEQTFVNVSLTLGTIDWRFFKSLEDPVTVKLTFALTDLSIGDEVVPMLHTDVITTHTKTLEINRNCSSDPCKPAYVALLQSAEKNLTLQQNQELSVQMALFNTGDPVEKTEFFVETFPRMDFSRIIEGFSDLQCNEISMGYLHCEMRPVRFYAHQKYSFVLNFFIDPNAVVAKNSDHVKVEVLFNSTEANTDMTKFVMISHFNLRSNVRVVGGSDFSELILASSSEGIFKYSVSFDVHNDGPSPLGANLKIPIASGHLKSDIVKGIAVTKGKCSGFLDLEIKSMNDPENIKSESLTDDEAAEEGPVEIKCGLPVISCTYLTCNLGYVKTTEFESVELTMDLDASVLSAILKGQSAESGFFVIPGDVQQYDNNIPAFINATESAKVALRVSVGSTGQQSTDILWYTIGGSAGGFLIFIIIALILWKCGFFNRKRRGEIDRAKRQSMMKQRQSNMMSSFVNKELNKHSSSPLNGDNKDSKLFRLSAKKDYPDLEIQDR